MANQRATLFDAVDEWAARHPSHGAFRFAGDAIDYGTLSIRSNQLAHWLTNQGIRRGDRVGLYLHKSLETAIAVFGVMKAGAAFVPLDPGTPLDRLCTIAEDCQLKGLVTHTPRAEDAAVLAARTPSISAVLGSETTPWSALETMPATLPTDRPTANDRAYIIFTSGSTGTPKGIEHTHASGLAYAEMAAHLYGLTPDDRLGNHSPLHFDMSTFEYFSGPIAGACTVIIPEPYAKLPASLSKMVQDERLTVWYSTPFAIIQMVEKGALASRDISTLRWVIFGGEPMSPKHLTTLKTHAPRARFSNSYGPAEVNQTTVHHLPDACPGNGPIPLGRLTPHAQGRIVPHPPTGAGSDTAEVDEGELLLATPAMMTGYWNAPALTAASIETDRQGQRWYRTGDLVRRDEQGMLHFLGRRDRQVKVRGYRIELDEIEHALKALPSVAEAAAICGGEPAQILAAISPAQGHCTSAEALIAALRPRLASYAVPSRIDIVENFPRTTSGKIDRRALTLQMTKEATDER